MKSILALDGGGIRGVFTLEVLLRIEEILRDHYRKQDPAKAETFVLRDHFDFFAGTSTGAIIATLLCWGRPVREILDLYVEEGSKMFPRTPWRRPIQKLLFAKLDPGPLTEKLQSLFLEADGRQARLGSKHLLRQEHDSDDKVLMVVVRNQTTGSAWPLTNNPKAKYNQRWRPDCNLKMPLWKLVRASTAAPSYFPPEEVDLESEPDDIDGPLPDANHAEPVSHQSQSSKSPVTDPHSPPARGPAGKAAAMQRNKRIFIDGSMTPYNNPAAIAAMTAVLPGYRVGWTPGPDNIRLVSVGTTQFSTELRAKPRFWQRLLPNEPQGLQVENPRLWLGYYAKEVPAALLQTIGWQQDYLCRCLGECLFGEILDSEVGYLTDELDAAVRNSSGECEYPVWQPRPAKSWFSYVRYNRTYKKNELQKILREHPDLAKIDAIDAIPRLREIGQQYALDNVKLCHLISKSSLSGNIPESLTEISGKGGPHGYDYCQ